MTFLEDQKPLSGVCLIVEDSLFDQRMFVRKIRQSGRELPVMVAGSISSARAALRRHGVRMMILDNTLPDGLGVDFATELAEERRNRELPIVLVTDWPSPFMFEKARRAGVKAVMGKAEFEPSVVDRLS